MVLLCESGLSGFTCKEEFDTLIPSLSSAHEKLFIEEGKRTDYIGWVRLPAEYDKDEFCRIKNAAKRISENSDVLVVIGIGGSYLGARAVIELLTSPFYNLLGKNTPDIIFAGCSLSPDMQNDILSFCEGKRVSVNVISKSGTTLEPMIAFQIMKDYLEKRYGEDGARERIFCTTDKAQGTLKALAEEKGYETFTIPDNIGGRFSVLTAVGLLPIATAGIDIDALMCGAKDEMASYSTFNPELPAYRYASARNILSKKGKDVEIFASFEPAFAQMGEWLKQLFGESEGKNHTGIFPAYATFTTDLHSLGQYIQDGKRNIFETVVNFQKPNKDIRLDGALEGASFLNNHMMSEINEKARLGTMLAHKEGGVPNMTIKLSSRTPYDIGALIWFFEFAVSVSGLLNGVNPFDQPGVEYYKRNMFALLGKPGYEEQSEKLKASLI